LKNTGAADADGRKFNAALAATRARGLNHLLQNEIVVVEGVGDLLAPSGEKQGY